MKDDAFWELGMSPKKKTTDTRPRAYDVSATEIVSDGPGEVKAAEGTIPTRKSIGPDSSELAAIAREKTGELLARSKEMAADAIGQNNARHFTEVRAEEKKTNAENGTPGLLLPPWHRSLQNDPSGALWNSNGCGNRRGSPSPDGSILPDQCRCRRKHRY